MPGQSTGLHRYIFLVFKQSRGNIDFKEELITNRDATRTKFSVRKFMAKYQLQPTAINFFQAQYDASVSDSIKQLQNLSHNG